MEILAWECSFDDLVLGSFQPRTAALGFLLLLEMDPMPYTPKALGFRV